MGVLIFLCHVDALLTETSVVRSVIAFMTTGTEEPLEWRMVCFGPTLLLIAWFWVLPPLVVAHALALVVHVTRLLWGSRRTATCVINGAASRFAVATEV